NNLAGRRRMREVCILAIKPGKYYLSGHLSGLCRIAEKTSCATEQTRILECTSKIPPLSG
ncbi:MAG: hypothetical protein ACYCY7_06345, partial [Gallionella sp.]